MKHETEEVKVKQEVVGTAKYPVYDNLDEAIKSTTPEFALAAINVRAKRTAINAIYADATREVSPLTKAKRKAEQDPAFAELLNKFLTKHEVG